MAGSRFDERGNEYRLMNVPEECCVVSRQMVYEDGETYNGELLIVRRSALHDGAPRQKLDSQIAEAKDKLNALCDQIEAKEADIAKLTSQLKKLQEQ